MGRSIAKTVEFDSGAWAPPVETIDDLWELAPDGQLCFVKAENCVFQRRGQKWESATSQSRRLA